MGERASSKPSVSLPGCSPLDREGFFPLAGECSAGGDEVQRARGGAWPPASRKMRACGAQQS